MRRISWFCAVAALVSRMVSATPLPPLPVPAFADMEMARLSARGAVSPDAHFDVEVTATGYAVIFR